MKSFYLDFVAIGPQRTGSSWLYEVLATHPQLCFPKGVKETFFFDLHWQKGLSWYEDHFRHWDGEQLRGEVAPTYFDENEIPARLHALNPQMRVLINLRNPADRALSLYRHHLSKGRVRGTFAEAIAQMPRIVTSGKYARHIPPWQATFGADRVKFLLLEDIETQPESVFKDVCQFLEIEPIPLPDVGQKRVNAASMPRFPWLAKVATVVTGQLRARRLYGIIEFAKSLGLKRQVYQGGEGEMPGLSSSDRRHLCDEYEADIAFAETLLGRDLSAWRH